MKEFLEKLFSSNFMPHGYCYLWNPGLVWLHVVSDALIALAYFSIPVTLIYFIRKRRDLPFHWMFACFGLFILACGATHAMEVWTLWHGNYWLSGAIKAVTAMVSVPTAILLVQLVPHAVSLPSPEAMRLEIAERKRTERALHDAKNDLELKLVELRREVAIRTQQASLLNLAHEPIFVRDMSGVVTYWNHGAEQLYGWTAEQALGKSTHDLLQTIFPKPFEDVQKELLRTGHWEGELEKTKADGKKVSVASRWSLQQDENETPVAILETENDITESKRRDEDIRRLNRELTRRSTELEATNKELEAFAYSVSHDLRAPLRHMVGFTELLQKSSSSQLDDKGRRYTSAILESAKRMGILIDDLLAFSRIGRAETRETMVSLGQLVKEAQNEVSRETEGRNVNWKIGSLPDLYGDRSMLKLVLVNLISNAIKFTRTRQTPEIEIGCTDKQADSVVVFVKDNGVGFDMKYVNKLFGVFQRLHRADEFEGTGIGLATVQRIIHRHGGQVWAEGQVGGGASFYFSLPKP